MNDWTLFLIVLNLTFLAPGALALWIARRQRRGQRRRRGAAPPGADPETRAPARVFRKKKEAQASL
jgi:hypothetical protein